MPIYVYPYPDSIYRWVARQFGIPVVIPPAIHRMVSFRVFDKENSLELVPACPILKQVSVGTFIQTYMSLQELHEITRLA
jgi:hypothetical protein